MIEFLSATKEDNIMTLLVLRFNYINKSRNFNESVAYLVSRQVCASCLNQFFKSVLFLPPMSCNKRWRYGGHKIFDCHIF